MEPVNPWRRALPGRVAHRGGAKEAPENTLYAFHRGLASGADAIELDVQGTADGVPIVLHDESLARVAGLDRRVDTLTLAEVQAADPCRHDRAWEGVATGARTPPPRYGPEHFRVPTLEDVLATFPGVPLVVELKETAPEDAVAESLRKWNRGVDVLVASFDDAKTAAVKAKAPDVATGPGVEGLQAFLRGERADQAALLVPHRSEGRTLVDGAFVRRAHAEGMGVLVWTIDTQDEARALLGLGVDLVVTDAPAALAPVFAPELDVRHVAAAFEEE